MSDTAKEPEAKEIDYRDLWHKEQARAVDAERKLSAFKDVDLDAYKAMKEELDLLKRESAKGKPDEIEKLVGEKEKEIDKRYRKKLDEYEKEKDDTIKELNRLRVINPTMLKAAEYFNSKELSLIQMLVERDLSWDNGRVIVKDESGKPKASIKNPREDMGIDEYLEELTELYPNCAKPRQTSGVTSPGQDRSANNNNNNKWDNLTAADIQRMTPQEIDKIPVEVLKRIF